MPRRLTRAVRLVRSRKCRECGGKTDGGPYCDLCGQALIERTRDEELTKTGPHSLF